MPGLKLITTHGFGPECLMTICFKHEFASIYICTVHCYIQKWQKLSGRFWEINFLSERLSMTDDSRIDLQWEK